MGIVNQTNYGKKKVGSFRTDQLHHFYKTLTLEFIRYIMNENH